jgi:hypothetical protein
MWLLLVVAVVVSRPQGKLLSESMQLLPEFDLAAVPPRR